MRIFALETDSQKTVQSFLSPGETLLAVIRFSVILFLLKTLAALALTVIFALIGYALVSVGLPAVWVWSVLGVLWLVTAFHRWLTALIDWRYDFIVVTTKEVAIVDQTSFFSVDIREINLPNIASVTSQTQYWDLFGFGRVRFDLSEAAAGVILYSFVPQAEKVAKLISDAADE